MADEPKFTPGPWRIDSELKVVNELGALARDIYSSSPDVAEGDTGICLVAIGSGDWADERREANARLIAAAPELLAACQCALRHAQNIGIDSEGGSYVNTLRDAINKALGQ